jgi:hypothetical protein
VVTECYHHLIRLRPCTIGDPIRHLISHAIHWPRAHSHGQSPLHTSTACFGSSAKSHDLNTRVFGKFCSSTNSVWCLLSTRLLRRKSHRLSRVSAYLPSFAELKLSVNAVITEQCSWKKLIGVWNNVWTKVHMKLTPFQRNITSTLMNALPARSRPCCLHSSCLRSAILRGSERGRPLLW